MTPTPFLCNQSTGNKQSKMKEGTKVSSWGMNGAVEDTSDRGFVNGDSRDFQYDSSDDFIIPTQVKKSILNPKLAPVTESILKHEPGHKKKVVLKSILTPGPSHKKKVVSQLKSIFTPERSPKRSPKTKKKVVLFKEKSEHIYLESFDDDDQSASSPAPSLKKKVVLNSVLTPERSQKKKVVLKSIFTPECTPKKNVVLFEEKSEELYLESSDDDVQSASSPAPSFRKKVELESILNSTESSPKKIYLENSDDDDESEKDTYSELFHEEEVLINERASTMGRRMEEEKNNRTKKRNPRKT